MKKIGFVLLSTLLISTTVLAGGSLFGGKSNKTSNTNGVQAINVHICSSLECPPIRIVEGSCDGEHMFKQWGVCLCEKGYVSKSGTCEACPEGQYSDGIHACTGCAKGTYKENEADTSCTTCPTGYYCLNGKKIPCPTHAECSKSDFICKGNYTSTGTACICPSGKYETAGLCKDCPVNSKTCDSTGKATSCKPGYFLEDGSCHLCPASGAEKCDDTGLTCIKETYYREGFTCKSCEGEGYIKIKWCLPDTTKYPNGCTKNIPGVTCDDTTEFCSDKGLCEICPPEPTCDGITCCDLRGPKDECGRPTPVYDFRGKPDAYGNFCYACDKKFNIQIYDEDECKKCPDREYYFSSYYEGVCYANKCSGFRDKEYGDCYDCSTLIGVKSNKTECDKCKNRVMTGEYCVLGCADGEILDKNTYSCVSCTIDADVISVTDDDCADSCPGLRKVDAAHICVRTCSGHGHEEKHKCVCDTGWYGPECDSWCGDFLDSDGICRKCDVLDRYESSETECSRCSNREWKAGYCHLKTCVTNTFRDNDVCYSCEDVDSIESTLDQCNKCTFLTTDPPGYLIKRELVTRGGKKYCEMTADYCASKGGVKQEAGKCAAPCADGEFRDENMVCRKCTSTKTYEATSSECLKCNTKEHTRDSYGPYCIPVCPAGEIFDQLTMSCVSCLAEEIKPIVASDCADRCPKTREMEAGMCVFSCSKHGIKEDFVCQCETGWYGPICDTECNGFKDDTPDKVCHTCDDPTEYTSSESECNRCSNRTYDSVDGKCKLTCPGFKDAEGNCHECTDETSYKATSTECLKYCSDKREMVGELCAPKCKSGEIFDLKTSMCVSCATKEVSATSTTECLNRCGGLREIVDGACVLSCSAHGEKIGGKCVCEKGWYGEKCDSDCNGFKDEGGECHECADTDAFKATVEECARCAGIREREMVSGLCAPICTKDGEIYDLDTKKCVPCTTLNMRALSNEDCLAQCPKIREVVDNFCVTTCSGHGTKESPTASCVCDPGWFGKTCDSDCAGFKDESGNCHSCKDAGTYTSSSDECDRCSNRAYKAGQCLPDCGDDGFEDATGVCRKCTDETAYDSYKVQCERCPTNREYIGSKCYKKCVVGEGFKDSSGICHACSEASTTSGISAIRSECDSCTTPARTWFGDKCYSSCGTGNFRDAYGYCHSCTDPAEHSSYNVECTKCGTARKYEGNKCKKA